MKKLIFGTALLAVLGGMTKNTPTIEDNGKDAIDKIDNIYLDVVTESSWCEERESALTDSLKAEGIEPYGDIWLIEIVNAYYAEEFGYTLRYDQVTEEWIPTTDSINY